MSMPTRGAASGGGNVLEAVGFPLPVTIIGEMLGVPEAEARLAGRNDSAAVAADLRDAAAMYRAMGARDPAERLAQEIGG